jgi:hypothetical protein
MNSTYQPQIQNILESIGNPNCDYNSLLNSLSNYLNNGAENLTLSQYKFVRSLVDGDNENSYKNKISQLVSQNKIDKTQVDSVGRLLTTYLRDQHYALLSLPQEDREYPRAESFYPSPKSSPVSRSEWEKNDRTIYELERKVHGFEQKDQNLGYQFLDKTEEHLIDSINPQALDKYNVRSINKMIKKTSSRKLNSKFSSLKSKLTNFIFGN